ncbi:hypothetical protein HMPREF9057_02213 [Actinomyces sp. oral taxon 171 str. F0337]|nr:hypothetical protein HMPREF9057_02213 [Actinomyces sp. oral taxon 171 str. F0337]
MNDVCLRSVFFLKRSAFIVALLLGRSSPQCGGSDVGAAVGSSARPRRSGRSGAGRLDGAGGPVARTGRYRRICTGWSGRPTMSP